MKPLTLLGILILCVAAFFLFRYTGDELIEPIVTEQSSSSTAEGDKMPMLEISKGWTRATPPSAKVAGGYVTITNSGAVADRLIGVSYKGAGRSEIHTMSVEDGIMRMAPIEAVEIAPGETVSLKPGGNHIMLMMLNTPMLEGETVSLTLEFEKNGSREIKLIVRSIGAKQFEG